MDINKDDRAKALLEAMNDCTKRLYEIGYNNGLMEGYNKCEREHANTYIKVEGYKEGLKDAWECAKRITLSVAKGGLSAKELTSIFYQNDKAYDGIDTILKLFTPEEAMEKIKEYDEKKAKNSGKIIGTDVCSYTGESCAFQDCRECNINKPFVPGDEVHKDFFGLGVVTSVRDNDLTIMWLNNGKFNVFRKDEVKKTGRSHEEICKMFSRYDEYYTEWCMDNINIAEKEKETKDE